MTPWRLFQIIVLTLLGLVLVSLVADILLTSYDAPAALYPALIGPLTVALGLLIKFGPG